MKKYIKPTAYGREIRPCSIMQTSPGYPPERPDGPQGPHPGDGNNPPGTPGGKYPQFPGYHPFR